MSTVVKYFNYKQADFSDKKLTLQECLQQALKQKHSVKKRLLRLDESGNSLRLLNSHRLHSGILCAELFDFTKGTNQAIVCLDDNASELNVNQVAPPPDKSGRRTEFIESILYFGCLDNHCVVVQSTALRCRQLEEYLNWLLGECSPPPNGKSQLALINHATPQARDALIKQVKCLNIGTDLSFSKLKKTSLSTSKHETQAFSFSPDKNGMNIIKALLATLGKTLTDDLTFEGSALPENLRMQIQLSYTRTTNEEGHETLDGIARAFRHVDGDDYSIQTTDGLTIEGNEMSIKQQFSVRALNGLPVQGELYSCMHRFLTGLIEGRKLKA